MDDGIFGYANVVKRFVEHELESGTLVERVLSEPAPSREIGFLYNDIQPFDVDILKFIYVDCIHG